MVYISDCDVVSNELLIITCCWSKTEACVGIIAGTKAPMYGHDNQVNLGSFLQRGMGETS